MSSGNLPAHFELPLPALSPVRSVRARALGESSATLASAPTSRRVLPPARRR